MDGWNGRAAALVPEPACDFARRKQSGGQNRHRPTNLSIQARHPGSGA